MKEEEIINVERALEEKKAMQKIFILEHSHPSSVLTLLITYLEERKGKLQ